jgi:hypothetical protein
MRRLRLVPVLALAAALAGCGGSTAKVSGSGGDGASVAPASAVAFFTVDTSLSSDQWKTLDSLLGRFPAKDKLLTELRTSFERDSKVSWEKDVKPALGDELDVVALDLNGKLQVVAMTQPKDEGKLEALVKKLNASSSDQNPAVTTTFDGWTLISDSKAKLDAFEGAASGAKLADDADFKTAMAAVGGDALAKVYVDTPELVAKLRELTPALGSSGSSSKALANLRSGAAALVAKDEGLEVSGRVGRTGPASTSDYSARFVDSVPAGALLYASFRGNGTTRNMRSGLGPALGAMPQLAPVFAAVTKLAPLFANENALYVLPGLPIPEVTLLTRPKSVAKGKAAITGLVSSLGPLLGGQARVRSTSLDGVPAKEIQLGSFSLYYGSAGGRVFLSSSRRVVTELGDGGQKLADDPTFTEARDAAGMPDRTSGFLYVNLKDSVPLIEGLAQLGGTQVPGDVDSNLRHLRTFLAFASAKTGEDRFTAFLGIK